MPRKWGESDEIKPGVDEAANYAAMERQRKKVARMMAIALGAIIAGSLLLIVSYWA